MRIVSCTRHGFDKTGNPLNFHAAVLYGVRAALDQDVPLASTAAGARSKSCCAGGPKRSNRVVQPPRIATTRILAMLK
ncbi:hypothetical protein [Burkholderia ubonensis]|uniref:hypothetical protein n=1 Tax=Burkholderia ubonensis TaxID=101571 RepID=UPI000AE08658|nr:hypothetical protein [Burkholderia ubonensis]